MSKIEIKKTELVWKGKYDDDGKLIPVEKPGPFPFQIVESINEPRIEKGSVDAQQASLYDIWKGDEGATYETGWKNKLIWGDNKFVMSSLLEKYAGKIDLIYIDPPFATGADFTADIEIGENGKEIHKEHSIIEEKAYRDTWGQGQDGFLQMMYERLIIMNELLSDQGSIFIHLDHRVNSHIRLILDEIFGPENFRNEIIWRRTYAGKTIGRNIPLNTDFILWYSKSSNYLFHPITKPLSDKDKASFNKDDNDGRGLYNTVSMQKVSGPTPGTAYNYVDNNGRIWKCPEKGWRMVFEKMKALENDNRLYFTNNTIREKYYLNEREDIGKQVDNLWSDIGNMNRNKNEDVGYPTQKPEALLQRIISACTNEGDLVVDFFCGSGTTCVVAEKLNRRWIGVDLGRYAIHTTRKRLLEIESSKSLTDEGKKYNRKAKSFEILNLGKYERQFWQVKAFGRKDEKQALYEYLAFILKLYGAEPISGSSHIHGKKGNALIYIGAVDAPVTIQEVTDALKDTREMGLKELHVLGWEWEMGLNDAIQEVAKQSGVRLKLRIIPMDAIDPQAAGKGDVKFFELAYFKTNIETNRLKIKVKLEDFVIPHTDLIDEETKKKITKWSDWVDYWAVDFDFRNDTFNNGWTSYRTKQERKLKLTANHEYTQPGTYKVFVKIIDIFGIDTSQVYEIKVR